MMKISLSEEQKALRKRILEISFRRGLSHLGSCLSCVDIIYAIYKVKRSDEKFVLSNGHAGIALYAVLEKFGLVKPKVAENLHVHPDRSFRNGIDVSTGSLGQGLPIALGLALSDRKKNVYCSISDGECTEGSIWEALRIASEAKADNLKIVLNANGWGAYSEINLQILKKRLKAFGCRVVEAYGHNVNLLIRKIKIRTKEKPLLVFAKTTVEEFPFLKGQDAHYYVMKEEDFKLAQQLLA